MKHKMQNDEALKILNIEGRKNLNNEVLLQVRHSLFFLEVLLYTTNYWLNFLQNLTKLDSPL